MVDFSFAAADLLARINAPTAPELATGWNGVLGTVDLAKPQDYTGDKGKICFSPAGVFNLRETLGYYAYICAGKPTDVAAFTAAINDGFAGEFFELAAEVIARYRIYAIFTYAERRPTFRATDRAKFPLTAADGAAYADINARALLIADEVHALFTADEASEGPVAEKGRMVLLGILAGAIHRHDNNGHSWYTAELNNPRSKTFKTCAVAGADKKDFVEYQRARGHDGPHHLSTESIHSYAMIIGQQENAVVPDTVPADVAYGGKELRGRNLKEVFFLGEATKGRYPPGVIGAGAMITGMDLAITVITDLGTRAKLSGHEMIFVNAGRLSSAIRTKLTNHDKVIALAQIMGPTLAWVWGYAETSKLAVAEDYIALSNHAKRHDSHRLAGVSCARAMKRVTPHKQAMEGTIVTSLNALADMITHAAALNLAPPTAPALPLLTEVAPMDATKVKAEVGTRGGGEVFYDAEE